jgi:diketogulonate reductase-like aldo/keto reductase
LAWLGANPWEAVNFTGVLMMLAKPIPSTGEQLPVIGCGTYIGFDVAPDGAADQQLTGVLNAMFSAGGTMIDSSPMYGQAEAAVGRLLKKIDSPAAAFLATKVWTKGRAEGIAQMQRSMVRLGTERLDLMQVHNLLDWRIHLATLRDWKEEGRIRYIGVTHYTSSAYAELESVLRAEPVDFVQLNYSVSERTAEQRLLPLAQERGIAVITNRPFGGGNLLRSLRQRPLPSFASELGCASWSSLLLKYAISHSAVTCAIPGTGHPAHMAENAEAGSGLLPDAACRDKIIACCNE